MIDLSDTLAAKVDQITGDDLMGGPRTVTVTAVRVVGGDQPVVIELEGYPGRPYKPGKSMRRLLVAAWGKDGAAYVGRRMTLYRDGSVKFGGVDVGGIRISHLSDMPDGKPLTVALTVKKGQKQPWTVEPLAVSAATSDPAPAAAATALDRLPAAMRYAGWDKGRVEQHVGHELAGFGDLTEVEAQGCIDAIRAEVDGEQTPSDRGPDDASSQVSDGEQAAPVEDPPYDEAAES